MAVPQRSALARSLTSFVNDSNPELLLWTKFLHRDKAVKGQPTPRDFGLMPYHYYWFQMGLKRHYPQKMAEALIASDEWIARAIKSNPSSVRKAREAMQRRIHPDC